MIKAQSNRGGTSRSSVDRFAGPDEETAKALRALIEILRLFRTESSTIPVSYVQAFLTICLKPGGGSTDYMAELDTIQPVMSRAMLALANKERRKELGESGMRLIDFAPDPVDLRRNRTFLTPKGRKVLDGIMKQMERVQK